MKRLICLGLLLCLVVVGCSKENPTNVSIEDNENIELNQVSTDDSGENEIDKTIQPNSLNEAYDSNGLKLVETVVPPYTELKVGPLSEVGFYNEFGYNFERKIIRFDSLAFDYHSFKNTVDDYNDYEIKFIGLCSSYGVNISGGDRENKTINGSQIFTSPSGKEIIYEFQFQLLPFLNTYIQDSSLFGINYYRLANQDEFLPSTTTSTRQPNVKVDEIKNADEFERLSNIFNDYINSKIDFDELGELIVYNSLYLSDEEKAYNEQVKNNKFAAKKIIKSNFINSGYDEYLVFFNRGKTLDHITENLEDFIDIIDCIIVKDNTVLQSYRITGISGYLIKNMRLSNFAGHFSQGYVGDFNKNGINEIIFICSGGFVDHVIASEFFDDHFETNLVPVGTTDFIYDWATGCFTDDKGGRGNYQGPSVFKYHEKVAWSDVERCYLVISEEKIDNKECY